MPEIKIPFGFWTPDCPSLGTGRLRVAQGCIPAAESYEPLRALAPVTQALAAEPLGAVSVRDSVATVHTYAGTATALYELEASGAWTDRSRGGGYSSDPKTRWDFYAVGARMIAANGIHDTQYVDMTSGGSFANLTGAPIASYVAGLGDFTVLARLSTDAKKLHWSAFNNPLGWTIGTDQCDEQILPDGGSITGIAGGDVMLILQEQALRRMAYVGPPLIMQIDVVSTAIGCKIPGSVLQIGEDVIFWSDAGWQMYSAGGLRQIGREIVDEWFRADLAAGFYQTMTNTIFAGHNVAAWSYTSTQSATGAPDSLLLFNWTTGNWAYARMTAFALYQDISLIQTLESLDASYGNLDAIPEPISLDDEAFAGGVSTAAGFTSGFVAGRFTGSAAEATFVTDDVQLGPGRISQVRSIRPLTDASGVSCGTHWRMSASSTPAINASTAMDRTGACPQRATGRFFRLGVLIPAGATWTQCQGVEIDVVDAGRA